MQPIKKACYRACQSINFRCRRFVVALWRGWLPYFLHGMAPKPHHLAVLAIFKNESHILREWVEHYFAQGATRIHLVNNGSTDDYQAALRPFIRSGLVVLHHDERRHHQVKIYNDLLPVLKREADWLLACDLDELIYARCGYATISSYLHSLRGSISSVLIPWKMFGSSGHLTQPKEGVRKGFVRRLFYGPAESQPNQVGAAGKVDDDSAHIQHDSTFVKCITRTRRVVSLFAHHHWILFGKVILPNGSHAIRPSSAKQPISEELLAAYSLHLNHYPIQSLEFFRDVKMKRGSVAYSGNDETYNSIQYFHDYDNNDVFDDELAMIAGP